MTDERILREQIVALLKGGHAHESFDDIVSGFPLEAINRSVPGLDYTPWRLLEHIRIAQWDILEFVRNPRHVSPPWPVGYWPPVGATTDAAGWRQSQEGFKRDLTDLVKLAEDPANDLTASLPHAPGYTLVRELLLAADHNAYHLGEFGILKTLLV